MQHYFVDLHIHIGRTKSNRPVKITASKSLTIKNIVHEASENKGLDMVGVIDCQVPEVLEEIKELQDSGELVALDEGGLRYRNVTLILGAEIEVYDENCKGPIHVLAFLPSIEAMLEFSAWLQRRMKNITLSTQRMYEKGKVLQEEVKALGGIFIPAHVFTPFKSLYGKGVIASLEEAFNPELIDGIELGLSANTEMADQIRELHSYTYVSNSDAHSLPKIAREYQKVQMDKPTFKELEMALKGEEQREIIANYGLDPRLGKYHMTTCEKCLTPITNWSSKDICSTCGHHRVIKGVSERLTELKNTDNGRRRPPYIHQVPLEFIPKLGPKMLEKLKDHFQTEMNILHYVPEKSLVEVAGSRLANSIIKARKGSLALQEGGGGKYGKVM